MRDCDSPRLHKRDRERCEAVKFNVLCGSTSLLNPKPSIYLSLLTSWPASTTAFFTSRIATLCMQMTRWDFTEGIGFDHRRVRTFFHRWTLRGDMQKGQFRTNVLGEVQTKTNFCAQRFIAFPIVFVVVPVQSCCLCL